MFYESGLESVTFADGASVIPDGAFRGCDDLETVYLPDTIERIGDRAFYYCDIESIYIPAGVREIGDYAFYECDLETVRFGGSEAEWVSIDMGNNYAIRNAFVICNCRREE